MSRLGPAAQKAIDALVAAGPFRLGDAYEVAVAAGAPRLHAYMDAQRYVLGLKAHGRVKFEGAPKTGQWRAVRPDEVPPAPPPVLATQSIVGPYDPNPAVEGPNNGLTEDLAQHLWHDLGAGDPTMALKSLSVMEQRSWREASERALKHLFDRGMVGPAGPREYLNPGWSYAWVYEASNWEITDSDGGCIALVCNDRDVPLILAAYGMASAIRAVLDRVERHGGVRRTDLEALRATLPVESPP